MSSIPEAAMPKAKAEHHEEPAASKPSRASSVARAMKDNPKTAAAIGAAVIAGAAAAIAAPFMKADKPTPAKKPRAKATTAKSRSTSGATKPKAKAAAPRKRATAAAKG